MLLEVVPFVHEIKYVKECIGAYREAKVLEQEQVRQNV